MKIQTTETDYQGYHEYWDDYLLIMSQEESDEPDTPNEPNVWENTGLAILAML